MAHWLILLSSIGQWLVVPKRLGTQGIGTLSLRFCATKNPGSFLFLPVQLRLNESPQTQHQANLLLCWIFNKFPAFFHKKGGVSTLITTLLELETQYISHWYYFYIWLFLIAQLSSHGHKEDNYSHDLTPSVHKTLMRCFRSCAFFTENRIAVFKKDVQLYLISFDLTFIIEILCLNIELQFQRCYVLFVVKEMWIQFIPATRNKFLKLAQYFLSFWLVSFGWKLGQSATYTMG